MTDVDHTPCIKALERLKHEMTSVMSRANEQIASTQEKLERLDRTNAELARTQLEMLREIRKLLETGRTSDALRYVVALCDTARPKL
jgi:single-stranded DNA-specific DHH superfamily exonuclease